MSKVTLESKLSEMAEKRIDEIHGDEQELLRLSTDHSLEHQYAADFRIGFRYGFNRGKKAGFMAALALPEVRELAKAMNLAVIRMDIMHGRMMSCRYTHDNKTHELYEETANFCDEASEALKKWNEFTQEGK